jgi:hypothetical protein
MLCSFVALITLTLGVLTTSSEPIFDVYNVDQQHLDLQDYFNCPDWQQPVTPEVFEIFDDLPDTEPCDGGNFVPPLLIAHPPSSQAPCSPTFIESLSDTDTIAAMFAPYSGSTFAVGPIAPPKPEATAATAAAASAASTTPSAAEIAALNSAAAGAPIGPTTGDEDMDEESDGDVDDDDATAIPTAMTDASHSDRPRTKRKHVASRDRSASAETTLDLQLQQQQQQQAMVSAVVSQIGLSMSSQFDMFSGRLETLMTGLDNKIGACVQESEIRLKTVIDDNKTAVDEKILELTRQVEALKTQAAAPTTPTTKHPSSSSRAPTMSPQGSPRGSPQSSDWVSRTGVVFIGGFVNDMPRQNIEEVIKHMITNAKAQNVENFWAPAKLGNSGRIQFRDNDSMWDFLKSWKLLKEKCRWQYGSDFFFTWAAKEKSFGRKQCDRITREVARLLKISLDQVPEDDFIVEYNRKKVFVLGAPVSGIRPPICIAETAFGSNTWTVQNLGSFGKSADEGPLTLQCQAILE